ncbi:hypothetical protein C8R45DRAFT_246003 [Mycena sanguinolenta]|nr:hypothetical protein C8R45DRAFT_246003 [Mycena sanguinolenta]
MSLNARMSLNGVLRTTLRHPSPSSVSRRSFNTVRPTTWSAKIWFRANGTPRRFVLGLVFSSLLSGILYTRWTIHRDLHKLGIMQDLVSSLVRIQCVDSTEFARVDFSSYRAAWNYFDRLGKQTPIPEALDMRLVGSLLEHTDKQDEAHAIMREAADSVHRLLAEGKNEWYPAKTGRRVVMALLDAGMKLFKLCLALDPDRVEPADKIKLHDMQMAVEGVETKNHEVLG